ncbi:hypothetical protein [Jidongwangia harbinensis]|uniref:hypothetical protein n=1 Tax=Jidongwangia harbinensis TaxID=2878561 RepID=UPI001CD94EA3|nr:hypothetical protein [Jidongwangia harbinensis]MCA2218746.1 hypothetical protein [Jidongwangia harbinensis]
MSETSRRPVRVLATAAALAALLAQSGCSSAEPRNTPEAAGSSPAAAPPEPSATRSSRPAGQGSDVANANLDEAILQGRRQVLIHLVEADRDLSASYEGPITTGPGTDDGARFRLVPEGDAYLIETLRPVEFEGRFCAVVKTGGERASLSTTECEPSDTTRFLISDTGKTDDKGRPAYHIKNDKHGFVQWSADDRSLYVQQVGDAAVQGSFSFVDRGAA